MGKNHLHMGRTYIWVLPNSQLCHQGSPLKPDISEFSYGYALTEELVRRSGLPLTAAPLFPSLLAEGRAGGGYDVHLPFVGFPLFLQFKLSDCMIRWSAYECQLGLYTPDFYRMHLRPLKHSQQHDLLLDLESKGYPVYYAAPHFHLPEELNDAYINNQVISRSVFFRPSEIGRLPDDEKHHVSFKYGSPAYLFSEPKLVREESESKRLFDSDLLEGYWRYPILDGGRETAERLANDLFACIKENLYAYSWMQPDAIRLLGELDPWQQIGYITRAFLGCEALLVAPEKEHLA